MFIKDFSQSLSCHSFFHALIPPHLLPNKSATISKSLVWPLPKGTDLVRKMLLMIDNFAMCSENDFSKLV